MASDLTKGRIVQPKDAVGGLKALYFINFEDVSVTFNITDTDVIEEMTKSGGTALTAYKYDLKGNSNFEQSVQSSRENGTTFFEQTINATLQKLDKTTHKEIKLMAYGRPIVVAHTKQGDAFAFGLKNGMELTGGTIVSGGAMGDLYGYTLVLSGQEKTPANFIDGSTEDNPFAGMTTPPTIITGT